MLFLKVKMFEINLVHPFVYKAFVPNFCEIAFRPILLILSCNLDNLFIIIDVID